MSTLDWVTIIIGVPMFIICLAAAVHEFLTGDW